jgi:hypothetical protein
LNLHSHLPALQVDGALPLLRALARALCVFALANLLLAGRAHASFVFDSVRNTVSDTQTNLVWDRCPYGRDGANCQLGSPVSVNWADALSIAIAANQANYRGYNDWRLPNRSELESLVQRGSLFYSIDFGSVANDAVAFPLSYAVRFWTSTSYARGPDSAWRVDFATGGTHPVRKTEIDSMHVRLVRGGDAFDGWRYCSPDLDGDGRVLPTTDGLIHARINRGVTGAAAIAGIVFPPGSQRQSWLAIRDYLNIHCGANLP